MIGLTGMVMVNRIEFSKINRKPTNLITLGSLIVDKRDVLGRGAIIDLRASTTNKEMARDLLGSFTEYIDSGEGLRGITFGTYARSIRIFLEYCVNEGIPDNFRMKDIDSEFLVDYRTYLQIKYAENKSVTIRRVYGNLLRLLKAGEPLGFVHFDLLAPRNIRRVKDSDTTQPYTAGEALDVESVCRNSIRSLRSRLEKGKEMLAVGEDPRDVPRRDPKTGRVLAIPPQDRKWNQLPNLLWYVVNVMGGEYVKHSGRKGMGHSSFNNATNGAFDGVHRKTDVYMYLYPLAEDLIPFIILIAKNVGLNESSILGLSRDCLQVIDGRYVLWYRKARGAAGLYSKIIDAESSFSPAVLIETIRQMTEPLVRFATDEFKNYLFLGLTIKGRGREPVKPLDAAYVKSQMNRRDGWCERQGLSDENGGRLIMSLRRWRVFYLTGRYKKYGQLAKISRDAAHTLAKTSVGYVANNSTRHLHERAVEAGITEALNLSRPIVIAEDSIDKAAGHLRTTPENALRVLRGEQDVFVASCRDFYNRPGGLKDTPCDKPWGCLTCSNAVITRNVLPRVLLFRTFMEKQRVELSPWDWNEKFLQAFTILTESIIPKFSPQAIAEAESYALSEKFYIPLSLK